MKIKQIIRLATKTAQGKDNLKEGAVGFNGYGFVFKDLDVDPSYPYVFSVDSQKLCVAGVHRFFTEKLEVHSKIDNFTDLLRYDPKLDLLLVGSVKTLVPTLQLGGFEHFFEVWMLVVTPENQVFPATLYWGKSGLSIGGWASYGISYFLKKRVFPEDFSKLINFTPFKLIDKELNLLLDALELALKKVLVSDFWGVSLYDISYLYRGIRNGKPFEKLKNPYEDLEDSEAEKKLESLLGREFKDDFGDSFSIHRLPELKLYYLESEYPISLRSGENKSFGHACYILDLYKKIKNAKKKKKLLS